MPQIAVKEERRVLWYASDGLNGKVRCLGSRLAVADALLGVLDDDVVGAAFDDGGGADQR